jgi:hypothetical protein
MNRPFDCRCPARKEHQRLGAQPAVLDAAERQRRRALAGLPRSAAQVRHGIGEARPIDVQCQPAGLGERGDGGHFIRGVDPPIFARLGNRDRVGLNLVNVTPDRGQHCLDSSRGQLGRIAPIAGAAQNQLGAVGVEPRGAAFVGLDMRFAVADHSAVRRDHSGQRQAVGGGSGRDPQGRARPSEQVGESRV